MLCENALFMQAGIVSAQSNLIDRANGLKLYSQIKVHSKPSFDTVLEDLPYGTPALHLHKKRASSLSPKGKRYSVALCLCFKLKTKPAGRVPPDALLLPRRRQK
jgi:hypothetical protein